jgi:hypothetical protein
MPQRNLHAGAKLSLQAQNTKEIVMLYRSDPRSMPRYEWPMRWNVAPVEVDFAIRTAQALEHIAAQLAQINNRIDGSAKRRHER